MTPPRTTRRRVLVVFHEGLLGGATLSVLRIVPWLEEQGWRFAFWAPRPSELFDHLEAQGREVAGETRVVSYSLRALRRPPGPRRRVTGQLAYMRAFRSALRALEPDVVHLNSLLTLLEGGIARRAGVPAIFHVHEMVPLSPLGRLAHRGTRLVADEVVAVSSACADRLAVGGWRPRIAYESAPIPERPLRREHPPGEPFRVGSVGVLERRKGADTFVAAARKLERGRYELELVGSPSNPLDAEWAEGVLAGAARAGVRHSYRADVPSKLAEWDAFVLPSRVDPFPIAVLEAMAAGLPVIGTRVDGLVEQLCGGAGILIEPEDAGGLARAIASLEADEDRRRELGERARRRVRENFTHERQAGEIQRAYEAALERGAMRRGAGRVSRPALRRRSRVEADS